MVSIIPFPRCNNSSSSRINNNGPDSVGSNNDPEFCHFEVNDGGQTNRFQGKRSRRIYESRGFG